ncbi:Programmed cell death protein 5 [Linnemannia zychae]|nr:Programmed cell death protein 5 [Linnemannia zychae]
MEDDELAQIRARRMAELKAQSGSASSGMGGFPLIQILDGEARERLSRIAIVKADKARAVEDLLIRMAQGGQVRAKITEKQLIELLEQVNQQNKQETKIVYNRRRYDDSDDDDYGL